MNLDPSEGNVLCELLFNGMIDILGKTDAIPVEDTQFYIDFNGYDGMFLFPKLTSLYSLAATQYQQLLNNPN
jgi:hypothetical protein